MSTKSWGILENAQSYAVNPLPFNQGAYLHREIVQTTRTQPRNHAALPQHLELPRGEVQTHLRRAQRVQHAQKSRRFLEIQKKSRFFVGVPVAFSVAGGAE